MLVFSTAAALRAAANSLPAYKVPDFDLIARIQTAGIVGRGGAEFPAYRKWLAVKSAPATPKYVICNASEHEPGVGKDFHLLSHDLATVFTGMRLAMETVGAKEAIINLNAAYYKKLRASIDAQIATHKEQGFTFRVFEAQSYIGGEETALLNAIEHRRLEPRLKPPYPTEEGLFAKPTLIHNVETFYDIARVADGTYDGTRLCTVGGTAAKPGVYRLPAASTVRQVLEQTQNIPAHDFFVQVGGGASGIVLNSDQIATEKVHGSGSIILHAADEDPRALLLGWLQFFQRESCGKCTPCREGTYQLVQLLQKRKTIPWDRMQPILDVLAETSFCPLGRSVPVPVLSYYRNVLRHQ